MLKIFCGLPLECFTEILKCLEKDHNTLFTCLLVNRLWSTITVPILRRKPDLTNKKVVRTLLLELDESEIGTLPKNVVYTIPQDIPNLFFKYSSYIMNVSSDDLYEGIIEYSRESVDGLCKNGNIDLLAKVKGLRLYLKGLEKEQTTIYKFVMFCGDSDSTTTLNDVS
ncbi:16613_t:CDS:2 [Gigaspora rosea]|nr:16613_t:CDS:2 [Gigaspora rosea]